MAELQVSTILFVVHCFYTSTLPFALFKHCGWNVVGRLAEVGAQQAAQAEAHRLEMEAVQAQRAAEAQRLQDMFSFMARPVWSCPSRCSLQLWLLLLL